MQDVRGRAYDRACGTKEFDMSDVENFFTDGEAYERRMGRWSRIVGEAFLDWLAVPIGLRWIDVGCGNGAFTEVLIARCAPSAVSAVDPSEGQLSYARTRPGTKLVEFRVGDALALPYPDRSFDAAAMALAISFVPDGQNAQCANAHWSKRSHVRLTRAFIDRARPGALRAYLQSRADSLPKPERAPCPGRVRGLELGLFEAHTASFAAFTGRALTIFRAGLALNTVGSFVNGLMPARSFVAGFLMTTNFAKPGNKNVPFFFNSL
jgi:SAM-dependent methyltransferase